MPATGRVDILQGPTRSMEVKKSETAGVVLFRNCSPNTGAPITMNASAAATTMSFNCFPHSQFDPDERRHRLPAPPDPRRISQRSPWGGWLMFAIAVDARRQ